MVEVVTMHHGEDKRIALLIRVANGTRVILNAEDGSVEYVKSRDEAKEKGWIIGLTHRTFRKFGL